MPPLNTAQARVVDPILTNHVRGYRHPEHIGVILMPRVTMRVRGQKRIEFRKESFILYNTKRAPGAATKRIQFGYDGAPVNLEQDSLEGLVPVEHLQEANAVPGIDMATVAVNGVMRTISLGLEVRIATKARDLNTYDANHKNTLAGTDQWSDPASNPMKDVTDAKEAVRATIGVRPNTMILGPKIMGVLNDHAAIKDRFKYTSSESVTLDMLARYFDMGRVVAGEAIYFDEVAGTFVDVWGKDVMLAYVPPESERAMENPAYGYTYTLAGHPFVEQPYQERNPKSWLYPVTDENSPEVIGAEAGFLLQNAIA